ncbi:transposase domain-containing protein [Bradyrhizobium sp. USDA 3397]
MRFSFEHLFCVDHLIAILCKFTVVSDRSRSAAPSAIAAHPAAWLTDVLSRLADHPAKRIDEPLPWNWRPQNVAHVA